MNVTIELMNASSDSSLPALKDFQRWTDTTMGALSKFNDQTLPDSTELSIRVIDEDESADLNANYRQKQGATNILSFPYSGIQGTDINLLGDLAICAPLVRKEAAEQDKTLDAHWAHLIVHGVLHLNGFDHEEDTAAKEMETLETTILKTLGYKNPYQELTGNE
ncbi:rRNA maturation RNase YbeY [Gammaproteobacteria bacterium]|nr:rRNA maturation RNase YbeY [Gammaproteobacteria bacterium]